MEDMLLVTENNLVSFGTALTSQASRRVPLFVPSVEESDISAVAAALRSGWLSRGTLCEQFERSFATYVDATHAVSLASCTAALELALRAAGVRSGDLVFMPSFAFTATAEAVLRTGATPVFVDV